MNRSDKAEPIAGQPSAASFPSVIPAALLNKKHIQRILVIKLRHFGDVLLTTPLLKTLNIHYPHALIDVLVYSGTQNILATNKVVNHAWTVDRELKRAGIKAQIHGEIALFNKLKAQCYDLIFNLSDQWRTAIYCRLLQPKYSVGFQYPKRDNRLWRYCHSKLVNIPDVAVQHTVLSNLAILEPLQLSEINTEVTMAYDTADIERVKQIYQQYNIGDYILIQPSARWKFKTWASGSFSQLINHFTARGETILLTGGQDKAELDYIAEIIENCSEPDKVINLAGLLTFPELAVLIDHARLFLGVDSVAMHIAAALQTPAVVLFGPSNLKQWHPWQAPYTLLWAGNYRTLPHPDEVDTNTTERYLDAIPVNEVISAVNAWLMNKN